MFSRSWKKKNFLLSKSKKEPSEILSQRVFLSLPSALECLEKLGRIGDRFALAAAQLRVDNGVAFSAIIRGSRGGLAIIVLCHKSSWRGNPEACLGEKAPLPPLT